MADLAWVSACFTLLAVQVPVPQHRMTPLKNSWLEIYKVVTTNLKLDMRMNLKNRRVRRLLVL